MPTTFDLLTKNDATFKNLQGTFSLSRVLNHVWDV